MSTPVINLQFGHHEIEIKPSLFEEPALEIVLEAIQNLRYEAVSVRKLFIPYGDPTKSNLYRYGITIPKNVDAEVFINWLVEQLRKIQAEVGDTFQINRVPSYDTMNR
jgi:hypothetical protein